MIDIVGLAVGEALGTVLGSILWKFRCSGLAPRGIRKQVAKLTKLEKRDVRDSPFGQGGQVWYFEGRDACGRLRKGYVRCGNHEQGKHDLDVRWDD